MASWVSWERLLERKPQHLVSSGRPNVQREKKAMPHDISSPF